MMKFQQKIINRTIEKMKTHHGEMTVNGDTDEGVIAGGMRYNVFDINGEEQEMKLIVLLSFDNDRELNKPDAL
jgi:hypothetical protein